MKFRKELWSSVNLKDLTEIKTGKLDSNRASVNGMYPFFTCAKEQLSINEYAYDCEALLLAGNNATADYDVKYYKGKFNAYQRTYIITIIRDDVGYKYLRIILDNSLDFFKNNSIGTQTKYLRLGVIQNLEIPLPPLEEQKQIASLFKCIETIIEQVEGQEKNLKELQKSLVNGLMNKEQEFGNLLNHKNCTATSLGEIAECDKKYPEHEKDVEHFVGLEYLEAENFQLQGFGEIANGTTFSKRFAKGDVLFGKRRAYLKKVAVAHFDGICSGDILVIRALAKKMLQGLLPYYISSDAFIQHAVSTSAGSLSPRTKWKDLAELEVSVPDLKTQEKILKVLQQLDNTVNQLKGQKTTLKNLKQKLLNEILG